MRSAVASFPVASLPLTFPAEAFAVEVSRAEVTAASRTALAVGSVPAGVAVVVFVPAGVAVVVVPVETVAPRVVVPPGGADSGGMTAVGAAFPAEIVAVSHLVVAPLAGIVLLEKAAAGVAFPAEADLGRVAVGTVPDEAVTAPAGAVVLAVVHPIRDCRSVRCSLRYFVS